MKQILSLPDFSKIACRKKQVAYIKNTKRHYVFTAVSGVMHNKTAVFISLKS